MKLRDAYIIGSDLIGAPDELADANDVIDTAEAQDAEVVPVDPDFDQGDGSDQGDGGDQGTNDGGFADQGDGGGEATDANTDWGDSGGSSDQGGSDQGGGDSGGGGGGDSSPPPTAPTLSPTYSDGTSAPPPGVPTGTPNPANPYNLPLSPTYSDGTPAPSPGVPSGTLNPRPHYTDGVLAPPGTPANTPDPKNPKNLAVYSNGKPAPAGTTPGTVDPSAPPEPTNPDGSPITDPGYVAQQAATDAQQMDIDTAYSNYLDARQTMDQAQYDANAALEADNADPAYEATLDAANAAAQQAIKTFTNDPAYDQLQAAINAMPGATMDSVVNQEASAVLGEVLHVLGVTRGPSKHIKLNPNMAAKIAPKSKTSAADAKAVTDLTKQAKALHAKTAGVHAKTEALHKQIKNAKKSGSAAYKAQHAALRKLRADFRKTRAGLKTKLLAAMKKAGATPPVAPKTVAVTKPATSKYGASVMPSTGVSKSGVSKVAPHGGVSKSGVSKVAPSGSTKPKAGITSSKRTKMHGDELPFILPSPLANVPDDSWTEFVLAIRSAPVGAVGKSNELGMFSLKPRRLADLGLVIGLDMTRDAKSGRMIWVGEFVPPLSAKQFLSNPKMQYDAFVKSMKLYVDGMRNGTVPVPDGGRPSEMSLSGALAVLHRCGPSGLKTWNDENNRFPDTQLLFTKTNGIF